MSNEVKIIDPKEYGLEETKTKTIEQAFLPKIAEHEAYMSIYNDLLTKEITEDTCNKAGDLRRKLVKVRTGIASIHKTEKAYHLAAGRYVDALKNKLTEPVTQMEEKLSEIEKYYENQEKERLAKIQLDRVSLLSKYIDYEAPIDLCYMADDVWEAYLTAKKNTYEDKIAAEKKAEEDRIAKEKAEAEERKRIEAENEKLKKEAEEKEKARIAELKAIEEKAKAEQLERERLAKIEADKKAKKEAEEQERQRKERAEYEAKIKAEKEAKAKIEREEKVKREKLEAELKAKEDAERKAKEEEAAKLQAELNKGDAAKVKDLIADLESLKTKYSFKSAKNKKMYTDVNNLLDKVVLFINK